MCGDHSIPGPPGPGGSGAEATAPGYPSPSRAQLSAAPSFTASPIFLSHLTALTTEAAVSSSPAAPRGFCRNGHPQVSRFPPRPRGRLSHPGSSRPTAGRLGTSREWERQAGPAEAAETGAADEPKAEERDREGLQRSRAASSLQTRASFPGESRPPRPWPSPGGEGCSWGLPVHYLPREPRRQHISAAKSAPEITFFFLSGFSQQEAGP